MVLVCCEQFHSGGDGAVVAVHHRIVSDSSWRILGIVAKVYGDPLVGTHQRTADSTYLVGKKISKREGDEDDSFDFSFFSSFNQICLPDYESYEQLQSSLLLAINEGSFGFEMI